MHSPRNSLRMKLRVLAKRSMTFERTMLIYRRGHSPDEAANY